MTSAHFLGVVAFLFLLAVKNAAGGKENWDDNLNEDIYFEGDILTPCDQIESVYDKKTAKMAKKKGLCLDEDGGKHRYLRKGHDRDRDLALRPENIWRTRKNSKVQVPYKFERNDFTSTQRMFIRKQLDTIEEETNVVQFVERKSETSYILVVTGAGCSSLVGQRSPYMMQRLTLGRGCIHASTIQHEFLHSLGFWHEQSRNDRDRYIKILYENVRPGKESNFIKRKGAKSLKTDYDYGSLMHYGPKAFSENGRLTIDSKGHQIGQKSGMSKTDVLQLRLMYQCRSGPRNLSEYNSKPCTNDCQCWKGKKGCNGNDNACQGDLVCRKNVCTSDYSPARSRDSESSDSSSDMTSEEKRKEKERKKEKKKEERQERRRKERERSREKRREKREKEKEERRKKRKGKF